MLASGKDYTKMVLIPSNIYDGAIATISYNPAANSTFPPQLLQNPIFADT